MNKRSCTVLCVVVLFFGALGADFAAESVSVRSKGLKYVAEFEGGKLFKAGGVSVVVVKGSYRQMGRQYGALLKDDLQAMHTTIGEVFLNNPDEKRRMTGDQLDTIARAVYDRYPQRYKEILYGMAETSDLGLDKILLVNALEWFPKIN